MDRIMTPATYLLLAAACVVTAVVYFEQRSHVIGADTSLGGICAGFLVLAAAFALGAVHLHNR